MSNYFGADRYYDHMQARRDAEDDAYTAFCEDHDLDPMEDHQAAFDDWVDGMREDAEIAAAEAKAERAWDDEPDYY